MVVLIGLNYSMIWFISDTHFYHKNIQRYCSRPDGWMTSIIENWQQLVAEDDWIIHGGDVGFSSKNKLAALFQILPGKKVLIRGNHDKGKSKWLDIGFDYVIPKGHTLEIDDPDDGKLTLISVTCEEDFVFEDVPVVYISHVPVKSRRIPRNPPGPYVYGHEHNSLGDSPHVKSIDGYNICVEVNAFSPISLRHIKEER